MRLLIVCAQGLDQDIERVIDDRNLMITRPFGLLLDPLKIYSHEMGTSFDLVME
jgi:hypothetical protein